MTSNWAWTIYILFSCYIYRHFPACLYWVLSALMTTWSVRVTLDYCSSLNGAPRWKVSSSYYHRQWNPFNLGIDPSPSPPHTHTLSHFLSSGQFTGFGNSFHGQGGCGTRISQLRYSLRLLLSMSNTGDEALHQDLHEQGAIPVLIGESH